MAHPLYPNLFKAKTVGGLRLKNRLTMAPLYLGYAGEGGKMSERLLAHYGLMAKSGVAMVVVENASITPGGAGSPRTIRCDHNRYLDGLAALASVIRRHRSRAALQLNHAGRFAGVADPVSASDVAYDDLLAHKDIKGAKAAGKVRKEGKSYVVQDGDILTILSSA